MFDPKIRISLTLLLVIATMPVLAQDAESQSPFDQLFQQVQADPAAASEQQMIQLMDLAEKQGRQFSASLAIKTYLQRHANPATELQLKAARITAQAGDYTLAAARYKSYLANARPDAISSDAAAQLYHILIDLQDHDDDAYQFMTRVGNQYRQSIRARRFDTWYLQQARKRKDYVNAAERLATIFGEKMPVDQEKALYWGELGALMQDLAQAKPNMYKAIPAVKQIVPAMRDAGPLKAEYELILANLNYASRAESMDDAGKAKAYQPVIAAAEQYFKSASSPETIRRIVRVLAGGDARIDTNAWQKHGAANRRLLVKMIGQMDAVDQTRLFNWREAYRGDVINRLGNGEGWADAGAKDSRFYAPYEKAEEPAFASKSDAMKIARSHAKLVGDAPGRYPVIVRTIAASDGDFVKAVEYFFNNECYRLDGNDGSELLNRAILPALARIKGDGKKQEWAGVEPARLKWGRLISDTPLAITDEWGMKEYLKILARSDQPDGVLEQVKALAWVPWDNNRRRNIMRDAYRDFRRNKKINNAPGLGDAFAVLEKGNYDINTAPNAVCKAFAQAEDATDKKDAKAFADAARQSYEHVKNWRKDRKPYSWAVLRWLTSEKPFDSSDIQAEILADTLKHYKINDENKLAHSMTYWIVEEPRYWRLFDMPGKDKDKALKFNKVYAQAVMRLAERGEFDADLFNWFRGTHRGKGWDGGATGDPVMAKLIETNLFEKYEYRLNHEYIAATPCYMYLVAREFDHLRKQYPPESWFDQRFVDEAKKLKVLDRKYWEYGRDPKKIVVNAAAEMLAGYQQMPLRSRNAGRFDSSDFYYWQSKAMQADSGPRQQLIDAMTRAYGKTRFDSMAMGGAWFNGDRNLDDDNALAAFMDHARSYADKAVQSPLRPGVPRMNSLSRVNGQQLSKSQVDTLVKLIVDAGDGSWERWADYENLARVVNQALIAQKREAELPALAGYCWQMVRQSDSRDADEMMTGFATELQSKYPDVAVVYAVVGLEIAGGRLADSSRNNLKAIKSKSMNVAGMIPVPRSDPRYPIYAAQAAYLTNKPNVAWKLYSPAKSQVTGMLKELNPAFVIWLIERHTEVNTPESLAEAENLSRAMLQLADAAKQSLDPEIRAGILLAYAGIAMAREQYPVARAQYQRIAANNEYDGTKAKFAAELKVADVDRITGNFQQAMELLKRLARRPGRENRAEANYYIARVKYDQDELKDALDTIEEVLALAPHHAGAILLRARIKLKRKEFGDVEIEGLGEAAAKNFIVPGAPLKIKLIDRNLETAAGATNIEVRVWTDSGDEEFFPLTPAGDSRTKFVGQRPTEMAPVRKRDGVIQLLGGDKVYYCYSEAFRKAQNIKDNHISQLSVVTDSEMYASSGRILSDAEREEQALEEMILKRMGRQTDEKGPRQALSTVRPANQVKPGNKINVRVIDPDRSVTADRDQVVIRVAATNGDSIEQFTLTETDTHSGVFEGAVPTAGGQATALVSDKQDGIEPNSVIAPDDGSKHLWIGLPNNQRPKWFSVDLNDSVELGKLTVVADVPNRAIRDMLVQVSMNGQLFTTVGSWPKPFRPWNGRPQVTVVPVAGSKMPRDVEQYLKMGYITAGVEKASTTLDNGSLDQKMNYDVFGLADQLKLDREGNYIAHFRAAFYQDMPRTRTFELKTKGLEPSRGRLGSAMLKIDGQGPVGKNAEQKIERRFEQGVHIIDIYVATNRRSKSGIELMIDSDQPPYMVAAPASMFSPDKHPAITKTVVRDPAKVTANGTQFQVAFAPDTQARVVRLLIKDFESDAPGISRMSLTSASGKSILPTQQSYLALRQNQQLEIVPGDTVAVTYVDPTALREPRLTHERTLSATYANANVSACFVNYVKGRDGTQQPVYVPMRRFKVGDTIKVFVRDPDADVSDQQDTVKVTVMTSLDNRVEVQALETGEHTGVFVGTVFPVAGHPARPAELQVKPGNRVEIRYRDKENLDPGIPWTRHAYVEQVQFSEPEIRIFSVASQPLPEAEVVADAPDDLGSFDEFIPLRRSLVASRPGEALDQPARLVIGAPMVVEVLNPAITKSTRSAQVLYLQTTGGLSMVGKEYVAGEFDPEVPGTIRLVTTPSSPGRSGELPLGYKTLIMRGDPEARDPMDDGRYSFIVPYELGDTPLKSLVPEDVDDQNPVAGGKGKNEEVDKLMLKAGEQVIVGMKYFTPDGQVKWVTRTIELQGDGFFDMMDRRYQKMITGIYVGENIYFRVIDPMRDTTNDKDTITLVFDNGKEQKELVLMETFSHSGIFKGLAKFRHIKERTGEEVDPALVFAEYGDQFKVTYAPVMGEPVVRQLEIFKGADGAVQPFTKRFKDPQIAVRTQFAIAEAYFELAKKHRSLAEAAAGKDEAEFQNQSSLARRKIQVGRKLLEEAIRDYPDNELRAQADYLLANLDLELANDAKDEQTKKQLYLGAVAKFTDIVAGYPDSEYAPKAQYKKGLVFEKLSEFDESFLNQACEEYVKLSYRYPNNELVAETIVRLGKFFLDRGRQIQKKADAIQAEDLVEAEKLRVQARDLFRTSAEVFDRMAARFPDHDLAGKTTALSGQSYMRARMYNEAVAQFFKIYNDNALDPNLRAESMYWAGDTYMRMAASPDKSQTGPTRDPSGQLAPPAVHAYRMFKKLTWDFPDSVWAKYARGRLASEQSLSKMDSQ